VLLVQHLNPDTVLTWVRAVTLAGWFQEGYEGAAAQETRQVPSSAGAPSPPGMDGGPDALCSRAERGLAQVRGAGGGGAVPAHNVAARVALGAAGTVC